MDGMAPSHSVLRLPMIFAKPNMVAPVIATRRIPRRGAGNKAIASPICMIHHAKSLPNLRTIQIANIAAAVLPLVARRSSRSTRVLRILGPAAAYAARARGFPSGVRRLLKVEAVENKTKYVPRLMDAPCTSL
jgi:hypothetical protein